MQISFYLVQNKIDKKGYAPIKFLVENRKKIANPEAVNKAFDSHLIPFLKQLQFTDGKVNSILIKLKNYWLLFSKRSITERALELKNSLVNKGVFDKEDTRDFSLMACERYLNDGLNHVLVGMRKEK